MLENTGHQEVKIADPLDSLFLRFATVGNKLITVPERLPKAILNAGGDKKNLPFPAPIDVRQIAQGTSVRYQKEEVITIAPGEKIQIVFDTQPVVMEKVNAALQSEAGLNGRSFKAKASLVLLNAPPETGGLVNYFTQAYDQGPDLTTFPETRTPCCSTRLDHPSALRYCHAHADTAKRTLFKAICIGYS